jgi:hypothetical protein
MEQGLALVMWELAVEVTYVVDLEERVGVAVEHVGVEDGTSVGVDVEAVVAVEVVVFEGEDAESASYKQRLQVK